MNILNSTGQCVKGVILFRSVRRPQETVQAVQAVNGAGCVGLGSCFLQQIRQSQLQLRSRQSDDVAEGCGRCADTVSLFTGARPSRRADWTLGATWLRSANPTCVRWAVAKHLRHMRTRAPPPPPLQKKIASVIEPGRRWDSPVKLTSPIFLHTFSDNDGILPVEGGSGGAPRHRGLVINGGRRRTRTHGKTASERPIGKKGEPWK